MKDILKPAWASQVQIVDLNGAVQTPQNRSNVIGIANHLSPGAVIDSAANLSVHQIVQETSLNARKALVSSGNMLFSASDFFNYPLSSILNPENCGPIEESHLREFKYEFNCSDQKAEFITSLENHLGTFIQRESSVTEIVGVADEIYSNAIFNAPFVNEKERRGAARGSGNIISEKTASFLVGHDESSVAMVAIDQYGSLKIDQLLKKIQKTYSEGADHTIQLEGSGGAGLGTFMVFENSCSMYLAVKPGEVTIVGVVIPINMSRKKKMKIAKDLHLIELS